MPIDFTPDPALYPFTSRWFDSSRGRVHYVDEGPGPNPHEDAPERITEAILDRFG